MFNITQIWYHKAFINCQNVFGLPVFFFFFYIYNFTLNILNYVGEIVMKELQLWWVKFGLYFMVQLSYRTYSFKKKSFEVYWNEYHWLKKKTTVKKFKIFTEVITPFCFHIFLWWWTLKINLHFFKGQWHLVLCEKCHDWHFKR